MPAEKRVMLEARLVRRMRTLGLQSLDDYRHRLMESSAGQDELVHFIDAVTTNKTDFFREAVHFRYLLDTAVPALQKERGPSARFALWCAGCSTGEEPYSIAMLMLEAERAGRVADFALLGTDVSTRVLEIARKAIYATDHTAPVSRTLRTRYLHMSRDPARDVVRISPLLRERVSFYRLNFMADQYPVRDVYDAIFFRNVAIYFDRATQAAVVTKLCQSLRKGGYFFTGLSESLSELDVPLVQVAPAVYRRT
jgi:chemotaxis protein methyltransferase CheR